MTVSSTWLSGCFPSLLTVTGGAWGLLLRCPEGVAEGETAPAAFPVPTGGHDLVDTPNFSLLKNFQFNNST